MRGLLGILLIGVFMMTPSFSSSQENGDEDAPVVVIPDPPYYIGRQFVYAVLLPEGDPQFLPEQPLPESPGIAIKFTDSRGFEQDGRKVRLYRFNVLPLQAGEVFLPPIHFRSNNRRISTDLRKLQVLEPVESEEVSIENTLSQSECYEGQPLQFKFAWELGVPAICIFPYTSLEARTEEVQAEPEPFVAEAQAPHYDEAPAPVHAAMAEPEAEFDDGPAPHMIFA